jgi:solute carrier family 25 protein 39/40
VLGQQCSPHHLALFPRTRTNWVSIHRLIGAPSATCYMLTYDHLLHSVFPLFVTPSASTPLFAGIMARTFISSVVSPLELVRTNLQSTPLSSSSPNTLRSVISSIATLARTQGPMSLWKGLGATLWRDVPFSGLYWANYEGLKSWFNRNGREGTPVAFASGAMSGIIAALFTSPFDVLKTRRQALIMSTPSHTTATVPLLRHMLRTEGYSALYAGIGPRMAKIAPACGMMIACYEGIGAYLAKPL